jgi:hypothetical protein
MTQATTAGTNLTERYDISYPGTLRYNTPRLFPAIWSQS